MRRHALPALIIGVAASIILLVYRASRARISTLGEDPSKPGVYEDIERHAEARAISGILVVRPCAPLFFYANAQAIRDAIESNVGTSGDGVRTVIIDLDASDEIDITSAERLDKLADALNHKHIELALPHLHQPVLVVARRAELLSKIGDDHVFPNVITAINWAR